MGQRTLLLRCDASDGGGVGHLSRCIALAQAASARGWAVHLSGRFTTPFADEILAGQPVTLQPAANSEAELLGVARSLAADVIHVDHYDGFQTLADSADAVVVSTATDGPFGRRPAAVIVDGSPCALVDFDPLYAAADNALGPEFLALRHAAPRDRDLRSGPQRVLVMMGGTDAGGNGPMLSQLLADLDGVAQVGLVGPDPGIPGVVAVQRDPDLPKLVADWDVVVSAAGTTIWELAAMGVPMGTVVVSENQRSQYTWVTSQGMAIGLGDLASPGGAGIDLASFSGFLTDPNLREASVRQGRTLVDGQGAQRVVSTWEGTLDDAGQRDLVVRVAELRDAGRLYAWRNDPVSREASRATEELAWGQHTAWFRSSLQRTDRRLYVGVAAGEPVGATRFDERSPGLWEVSITVAPAHRGQGYASPLVGLGIDQLRASTPSARQVLATLRTTNTASRAVFQRLGFGDPQTDGEWETWMLEVSPES